jgi:hypothetical protein
MMKAVRWAMMLAMSVIIGVMPASAMTVSAFLTRADALKAKGALAMFQRDEIKALTVEVQSAADAFRADAGRAKASGDRALGCPRPKGKAKIGSNDLIESFRAIPAERRKTVSVKSGFYEMMKSRYPCP